MPGLEVKLSIQGWGSGLELKVQDQCYGHGKG